MNIKDNVTIVIPSYNEEKYIEQTLNSIFNQKYIEGVKILIADNKSSDNTINIILSIKKKYENIFDIEIIDGGKVSEARNKGASFVDTKYILFLDADSVLLDCDIVYKVLSDCEENELDLMSAEIASYGKNIRTSLVFLIFNYINRIMSLFVPFAVGGFFFTRKDKFHEYGGFDETLTNSEDFWLSKKYDIKKFKITKLKYGQDDRRFIKMGYFNMIFLIFNNFLNRKNINYFRRDVGYWS